MGMSSTSSYEQLDGLLRRDELSIDPAELQGLLCALLSGQPQTTPEQWLTAALGEPISEGQLDNDAEQQLLSLFTQTVQQLDEGQFALDLLLPDEDSAAVPVRAEAMVHWGSGYLSGLGHLGADFSQWSDDAREFITDLAEITKADFVNADDELDDEALTELVEYLRVGAMLVFETLREPTTAKQPIAAPPQPLH